MSTVREETQRETLGGLLGAFTNFADWVGRHPWRSLVALPILGFIAGVLILISAPDRVFGFIDRYFDRSVAEQLRDAEIEREQERIDDLLRREVRSLRLRTDAARTVVRLLVFDRDNSEQIVGVVDVFESMDPAAESTGLRHRDLPVEAIDRTLSFMLADPSNPRCIARNADEFEDPELRSFLSVAGLKSSVACPIKRLDGEAIGLLAVSKRSPLERSPGLERAVRDTSLLFSGYLSRSPAALRAMERKRQAEETT